MDIRHGDLCEFVMVEELESLVLRTKALVLLGISETAENVLDDLHSRPAMHRECASVMTKGALSLDFWPSDR